MCESGRAAIADPRSAGSTLAEHWTSDTYCEVWTVTRSPEETQDVYRNRGSSVLELTRRTRTRCHVDRGDECMGGTSFTWTTSHRAAREGTRQKRRVEYESCCCIGNKDLQLGTLTARRSRRMSGQVHRTTTGSGSVDGLTTRVALGSTKETSGWMTVAAHVARSRKQGYYGAACLLIAVLAVAAALVLTVHRGLWPPPQRSHSAQTARPG
jgi:hypothetical protein